MDTTRGLCKVPQDMLHRYYATCPHTMEKKKFELCSFQHRIFSAKKYFQLKIYSRKLLIFNWTNFLDNSKIFLVFIKSRWYLEFLFNSYLVFFLPIFLGVMFIYYIKGKITLYPILYLPPKLQEWILYPF